MRQIELNNQLRDILISGAVADALGADIEFMPNPTKDDFLHEVNGTHPLRITDDTQMSLFTAEALLKGYKKHAFKAAYLRWYQTQIGRPLARANYSLLEEPMLYSQRAPGNTCMDSLRE